MCACLFFPTNIFDRFAFLLTEWYWVLMNTYYYACAYISTNRNMCVAGMFVCTDWAGHLCGLGRQTANTYLIVRMTIERYNSPISSWINMEYWLTSLSSSSLVLLWAVLYRLTARTTPVPQNEEKKKEETKNKKRPPDTDFYATQWVIGISIYIHPKSNSHARTSIRVWVASTHARNKPRRKKKCFWSRSP